MFPKQFWLTFDQAVQFGDRFIKKLEPSYDVVGATISMNTFSALYQGVSEPGIGQIITVPDGMLPAFNEDVARHGGIRFMGHF